MPRTTRHQFLQSHHRLALLWSADPSVFGHLTPAEQWQLHDYFRPSEDLTDSELLLHRERISGERPSLPQSAGRALKQLQQYAKLHARKKVLIAAGDGKKSKRGPVTVAPVVKPQIDVDLLTKALIQAAEDLVKQDRQI